MKRILLFIFFILISISSVYTQNLPQVTILSLTQLPPQFFKQGDSNTFPCAISYDGNIVVTMQTNFTKSGQGKKYHIPFKKKDCHTRQQ